MQFNILFLACFMLATALMVSSSPTIKAAPCLLGRVKGVSQPKVKGYGSKEYRRVGSYERRGYGSKEFRGKGSKEYRGTKDSCKPKIVKKACY